jgi:hypothetical protein
MKEAIERAQLLSKKTTELKALFENEEISIEQLRTLTFNYDDNANYKLASLIVPPQEEDDNKKKEIEEKNE